METTKLKSTEKPVADYVGKFVCYGNEAGMFCWGRIEAESVVNSPTGPKEVFILVDRMSGPHVRGRIERHDGRTTVRKERLNLETDVVERRMGLEDMTEEDLFLLMMSGSIDDAGSLPLGAKNMLKHEVGDKKVMETAKEVLRDKLGE